MMQLADELGHRVAHQAGVGIERHHILDAVGDCVCAGQIAGILVATQQQIQLMQLPALALPAHPDALARVELASPVQQIEALLAVEGIFCTERGDLGFGVVQDFQVGGGFLGRAVLPVTEEREIDLATRICEVVHLDVANELVDDVPAGDHAGHDQQRAGLLRNAILEFVAYEPCRFDEVGDQGVEQPGCTLGSRQSKQKQEEDEHGPRHSCIGEEPADNDHGEQGKQDDGRRNGDPVEPPHPANAALQEWRPVAHLRFQLLPSTPDEKGTDILFAGGLLLRRFLLGKFDCPPGDLDLRSGRAAGKLLDAVAVAVARAEIEIGIVRPFPENPVDMRDILEPDAPLGIVDLSQALDDIAHGDVAGSEAAVLRHHHVLGVRPRPLKPLLKPRHRKIGRLRGVPQPVEELRHEGVVLRERLYVLQDAGTGGLVVEPDDGVSRIIGLDPHSPRAIHAHGNTAKILDQDEAQDRGECPELADLQWIGFLETLHHGGKRILGDGAVRMRDVEPGKRHDPRHLLPVYLYPRQLLVEAPREVAPDFLDCLFNDIVVIQKPFCRRRDGGARIDISRNGAIDPEDLLVVGAMPREELELRKFRQVLQPVAAETPSQLPQFVIRQIARPDRVIVVDLLGVWITRRGGWGAVKGHGFGFWLRLTSRLA